MKKSPPKTVWEKTPGMKDYLEWSGLSLGADEEIKKFLNLSLAYARTLPEKIRNSKREKS